MFIGGDKKFVTLSEAAKFSGYTSDHLARLMRRGEIPGKRVGKIWFAYRDGLDSYLIHQNRLSQEISEGFVSLSDASKLFGYSSVHLIRLVRKNKIGAERSGRSWFVCRKDLENYVAKKNTTSKTKRVIR